LPEDALDHADGDPVDLGDLGDRHSVLPIPLKSERLSLLRIVSLARYPFAPHRATLLKFFGDGERLDVAENLAAAFDLDLAVADRPEDPAGRLDQEPVADDQITFGSTRPRYAAASMSSP
jgi:hypothetical protein